MFSYGSANPSGLYGSGCTKPFPTIWLPSAYEGAKGEATVFPFENPYCGLSRSLVCARFQGCAPLGGNSARPAGMIFLRMRTTPRNTRLPTQITPERPIMSIAGEKPDPCWLEGVPEPLVTVGVKPATGVCPG